MTEKEGMEELLKNNKDYSIHTPEADAERKRRMQIMLIDAQRRGGCFSEQYYFCEKCGMWFHGLYFLFCRCLYDLDAYYSAIEKEMNIK